MVSLTDATAEKRHDGTLWSLTVFGVVSLALLLVGGWLTYAGMGPWYDQLNFPPYQPPPWVFTPAWIVVLSLLAVATWQVASNGDRHRLAFALYGAQCVLNAGWSLLFFTLRRPDAALWELIVLDVVLLLMILLYFRVRTSAGLLLVPYFLWLLYATAINGWISIHHPV